MHLPACVTNGIIIATEIHYLLYNEKFGRKFLKDVSIIVLGPLQ